MMFSKNYTQACKERLETTPLEIPHTLCEKRKIVPQSKVDKPISSLLLQWPAPAPHRPSARDSWRCFFRVSAFQKWGLKYGSPDINWFFCWFYLGFMWVMKMVLCWFYGVFLVDYGNWTYVNNQHEHMKIDNKDRKSTKQKRDLSEEKNLDLSWINSNQHHPDCGDFMLLFPPSVQWCSNPNYSSSMPISRLILSNIFMITYYWY